MDLLRAYRYAVRLGDKLSRLDTEYIYDVLKHVNSVNFCTSKRELNLVLYGCVDVHKAIKHDSKFDKFIIDMTDEHNNIKFSYEFTKLKVIDFNLSLSYDKEKLAMYYYTLKFKHFREILC